MLPVDWDEVDAVGEHGETVWAQRKEGLLLTHHGAGHHLRIRSGKL